jgi:thiamine biosynthesis protein ThiS
MITIEVNGEQRRIAPGSTISQLLEALGVRAPLLVVEHNQRILKREEYSSVQLNEGDTVEIVHFVGGG